MACADFFLYSDMKFGNYDLQIIETGNFSLDGGAMFGVVPKTLWNKTNPADEFNRIELSARTLLAIGNGKIILIDDGLGEKLNEKLKSIYKVDNSKNDLQKSLKKFGLTTKDITDVILTHCHFDHCGGSTKFSGEKIVPTFENAIYHVQKDHWQLAETRSNERDKASFISIDFEVLKSFGQLNLIEGEKEIFPGIDLIVCNGHTNSQQLPLFKNQNQKLLFCCDLVPTTSHLPLPYIMGYDLRPLITLEEKRKILFDAANENWFLFFEHDPFTPCATIKNTEKGFAIKEKIIFS